VRRLGTFFAHTDQLVSHYVTHSVCVRYTQNLSHSEQTSYVAPLSICSSLTALNFIIGFANCNQCFSLTNFFSLAKFTYIYFVFGFEQSVPHTHCTLSLLFHTDEYRSWDVRCCIRETVSLKNDREKLFSLYAYKREHSLTCVSSPHFLDTGKKINEPNFDIRMCT